MNKLYCIVQALCFSGLISAMNHDKGKGELILRSQSNYGTPTKFYVVEKQSDIAFIPLNKIKGRCSVLWSHQKDEYEKKLSNSLVWNVAQLPKEVCYNIVRKMMDNDEKSTSLFLGTPLIYAFKFYDQARKDSSQEIGGKQLSVGQWFRMPQKQSKILSSISHPSVFERLAGRTSDNVTQEQRDIIVEILDEDDRTGVVIKVLDSFKTKDLCSNKGCSKLFTIIGVSFLLPAAGGGIGYAITSNEICGMVSLFFGIFGFSALFVGLMSNDLCPTHEEVL